MNEQTPTGGQYRDEDLMAYADGVLPLPQAEAIRRAAAADPAVAARIAMFRRSRALLANAFSEQLESPVPERLLALFDADAIAAARATPSPTPKPPAAQNIGSRRPRQRGWMLALAASVLLTVLVSVLHRQPGADAASDVSGAQAALDALVVATLERNLSGEPRTDGDPVTREVLPLATFVDADGRYCRDYETTAFNAGEPVSARARACRDAGRWEAVERRVAAVDAPVDAYAPASGQGAIDGRIVDAETEAGLIAAGWAR